MDNEEDHQNQTSEMTSSSSDKPDNNPDLALAMSLHDQSDDNDDDDDDDEEIDEEDEDSDYEQELGFLEEEEEEGGESEMDEDEIDPTELMELGETTGAAEDRGLSAVKIPLCLCPKNYATVITGSNDQCVVCQTEYEEGEPVVGLSCMHVYHAECITKWLRVKNTCPVCNMEISPPSTVEDVAKMKI